MADGTAHKTIVIKIKGSDPLCVSAERLTADSRKFRELINELSFTEEEMYDFDPDTVCLFLTLLEDRKAEEIQDQHFRELHKMAFVYEVDWLIEKCHEWLVDRINSIDSDMDYEARLYVFEECRYILNKWEVSKLMDILMSKVAIMDNKPFISQYMQDFDKLNSNQLDLMLKLGGSNTKLFLEIVLQNISGKQSLDSNTKHLLDKMNLALCLEQNEQLYDQLLETLLAMSELTTTDFRFIFKLSKDSSRIAGSRNTKINRNTTLYDQKEWQDMCKTCNKLEDITCRVEDKRTNNMFVVVELLIYVTHLNSYTIEEAEVFLNSLENICQDNPLKKISPKYIDSIISPLKLSPRQQKVQLIALLEKIKNNGKFTSSHDNVITSVPVDNFIRVELATGKGLKLQFEFKHPGAPECHMSGKCGFIVKASIPSKQGEYWKFELCRQDTDYNDTGLHLHEIVSTEDMYYFGVVSGTTQEGKTVRRLSRLWWDEGWWFPNVKVWQGGLDCVYYNVSKYLIAKQD